MPYEPLTAARVRQALRRLGQLAVAEEITLEISLYGGAVFTLVYGSRDARLCGRRGGHRIPAGKIRPKSVGAVEKLFARFFPDDDLGDRARLLVARVLKEAGR